MQAILFGTVAIRRDLISAFNSKVAWEQTWMLDSCIKAYEEASEYMKIEDLAEACASLCIVTAGTSVHDAEREFARQLKNVAYEPARDFLNQVSAALAFKVLCSD